MDDQNRKIIWQFIRGDLPVRAFEEWSYVNKYLEDDIGQQLYIEVISTNFKELHDVCVLRKTLEEFMRQKLHLSCECVALSNLAVTEMGSEQEERIWETLEETKVYGESRWWLALYLCRNCAQFWLVAQESRQNDVHCLKRMDKVEAEEIIKNNEWPKYFETLEELLAIGRDNNRSVRFVDPLNSSLVYSIEDLKKARPNISNMEIASLLNIDESLVYQLCSRVAGPKRPW